jgi:hypothetical protein
MMYRNNDYSNKKYIAHSDDFKFENEVKKLLLYRKVVKAERTDDQSGILTLDNGVQIVVEGNEGCGGCGNGWYYLDELNTCDNAITDVECVLDANDKGDDRYHIFIFADNKKINCVQYSGSDNGYYGTGYDLYIRVGDSNG